MKTIYMKKSALQSEALGPSSINPIQTQKSKLKNDQKIWRWGEDNLLPVALSALSRSSVTHRRILIDKADYISGRGFKCDNRALTTFIEKCNPSGQSLRSVIQRATLDKCLFGNAAIEVVIQGSCIAIFHQDISRARLAEDKQHLVFHHNWANFKASESSTLPIYPLFEKADDGTQRSVIHYKDYEPMFENYGSPKYIAALGAIAIAHKTDRWNIARLDNAFQLSGVMILDGQVDSPEEASQIARQAEQRFSGNPGQVMFMIKNSSDGGDNSKFVPINADADGDWRSLHEQSTSDIIVAHSWFRTLSGLEYVSGFSADRVKNEYDIALSTVIRIEQKTILEPLVQTFSRIGVDAKSLDFVNLPPFDAKPAYMQVWEARKADGMEYDRQQQSQFLSQI